MMPCGSARALVHVLSAAATALLYRTGRAWTWSIDPRLLYNYCVLVLHTIHNALQVCTLQLQAQPRERQAQRTRQHAVGVAGSVSGILRV